MKKDDVHLTMRRVTDRLREEKIPYAVLGGMAIALHGYLRATNDVDLLTTKDGLERIHARLVDLITTGEYPGDGKPKAVQFPDPSESVNLDGINVLSLPRLIEGKIVTGTTVDYRQLQDLGDVQALIRALRLPRSFADEIDPTVRGEFDRLWLLAQKRNPDFD